MPLDLILGIVLYTFGIFAFGTISAHILGLGPADGRSRPNCAVDREAHVASTVIVLMSFVWFVVNLGVLLLRFNPDVSSVPLQWVQLLLQFGFPAMIMHVFLADARQTGTGRLDNPAWRWPVWTMYAVGIGVYIWSLLGFYGYLGYSSRTVSIVAGISTGVLFSLASIFSVVVTSLGSSRVETVQQRASRRTQIGLLVMILVLLVVMFALIFSGVGFPRVMRLITTSLPLAFVFAGSYHENRFEFFDLFIKRGLTLVLTLLLLVAFFGGVVPRMTGFVPEATPWIYAVLLLPLVASLPWLHRGVGALVDYLWLGRRPTTVEAVKEFLSGLQGATEERQLVERAEMWLSTIFRAPTRIELRLGTAPPDFDCVLDVPIHSSVPGDDGPAEPRPSGVIFMGRRANQMPYFSEDSALLGSLADVFSYMLEAVRLQQREKEQKALTQELSLEASRSELKALRAQINPHFLFNALNAIAGLIHKDPLRADQTVEQLAEVFRYTLRGSQDEWVLLDDELEFVEAYLSVEQARFGERLQVGIEVDDEVRRARIPTMVVQTVVENAVKHGVARLRGPARIEISARSREGRLLIEIADSGEGFDLADVERTGRPQGGYGLRNILERFRGHFGNDASLEALRDEERGMTVVRLTMPLEHDAGSRRGEARA